MRWMAYFVLAYLALGIQSGLVGPYARVHGAPANLVLLVAIFIASNAPRESALLGCFVLGLMQDLLSVSPLGLYALSYGLVGLMVVGTQETLEPDKTLSHVILSFASSLLTAFVLLIHGLWRGPHESIATLLLSVIYTTLLGVVVLGLLQRIKKAFAFQPARRRLMRL